jgi:hypothetical protein
MKCDLCGRESTVDSIAFTKAKICGYCAAKHSIAVNHIDYEATEITSIDFEGIRYTFDEWQRVLKLKCFL